MRLRWILWLLIGACLAACGGLGGEPEIIATVAPEQPALETALESDWQPNIVNGARIFAEHCTECHGISGDGQGDLVLAGSVEAPLDMTERALVALKSPLEWFEIITEGRIEKLMPPWRAALSEGERWDVALYAYSLNYDEALLARGEQVWQENCDACELPAVIPPVFSDVDYGAQLNRDLFESALTAEEAGAAVAHLRSQLLEAGATVELDAQFDEQLDDIDDEPVEELVPLGALSGRVEHGTAGGTVPADTVLQLEYGNAELGFSLAETVVDEDFHFRFEQVPLTNSFSYVLGAVYGDRIFNRLLSAEQLADGDNEQTITVYDFTSDPSVVSVAGIDILIEALQLEEWGRGLYVSQIIRYRNKSDRIYSSGRGFDDGREAVLLVEFPVGARLLSGAENGRYVVIEDMERLPNSVIDTLPVAPGDGHQLVLEYFLPYESSLRFEQNFNNAIEGELTVTAPRRLQIFSDVMEAREDISAREDWQVYAGSLAMESAPKLSFHVNGDPYVSGGDDGLVITGENLPILLLGVGAVAIALLVVAVLLRRRKKDDETSEIDRLVAELARLEDDHEQGRVNHDWYHQRRRELTEKLAGLMGVAE